MRIRIDKKIRSSKMNAHKIIKLHETLYIFLSNRISHIFTVINMPGYLGDKETMVVHHLANMKKQCNVYAIKISLKQYFTPDTIENAQKSGFRSCQYCN